jgi:hypothetical protein
METLTQHLNKRHCNLQLHRPWLDEENHVATFPLWNLSGQMVGYQQYRPNANKEKNNHPSEGRYFTFRKMPTLCLFGVESLHLTPNVVFLTEGVFDACRLTERGVSALAVLSCDVNKEVRGWLKSLNRLVVAVCDDDAAGRKLAKFGDVAVTMGSHDLGDATDEEVTQLLKRFGL